MVVDNRRRSIGGYDSNAAKSFFNSLKKVLLGVDFSPVSDILFSVMRDKTIFKLTWKNEDSNRVSSREFENEKGVDHSGSMAALNLAQQADNNGWPWIIEKNGETMCHGQGGDLLEMRLFPTCG